MGTLEKVMGDYKNGLFDCFGNCGLCLITYFLPCYTVGKNTESLDQCSCIVGGILTFVPLVNLIMLFQMRQKANEKVGQENNCLKDLAITYCCGFCSVIQIRREFCDDLGQEIERV